MKAIELQRCARVAIETCGSVRPKERVLIVTDTMRDQSVARALMAAALAADAEPVLMVMPTRRSTPQEPPAAVRAAMQAADIAFLYTTYSLTHSSARVEAQKTGARIITMPGVTEDGLPVGIDGKLFGDQFRQLFRDIAPHAVIAGERLLRRVDIEAGAEPEIIGILGIARHAFATRTGVRCDEDQPKLCA